MKTKALPPIPPSGLTPEDFKGPIARKHATRGEPSFTIPEISVAYANALGNYVAQCGDEPLSAQEQATLRNVWEKLISNLRRSRQ